MTGSIDRLMINIINGNIKMRWAARVLIRKMYDVIGSHCIVASNAFTLRITDAISVIYSYFLY